VLSIDVLARARGMGHAAKLILCRLVERCTAVIRAEYGSRKTLARVWKGDKKRQKEHAKSKTLAASTAFRPPPTGRNPAVGTRGVGCCNASCVMIDYCIPHLVSSIAQERGRGVSLCLGIAAMCRLPLAALLPRNSLDA
jgi:hypothetical protein